MDWSVFVHPPLLPVHSGNGPGGASILDPPWLWLRSLYSALGHIKWDVNTAAECARCQAQANLHNRNNDKYTLLYLAILLNPDLPTEFKSGIIIWRQMWLHCVIKSKVDHIEKSVPPHGGCDAFTQQPIPANAILLDDLSGNWPGDNWWCFIELTVFIVIIYHVVGVCWDLFDCILTFTTFEWVYIHYEILFHPIIFSPQRDSQWLPRLPQSPGQPEKMSRE